MHGNPKDRSSLCSDPSFPIARAFFWTVNRPPWYADPVFWKWGQLMNVLGKVLHYLLFSDPIHVGREWRRRFDAWRSGERSSQVAEVPTREVAPITIVAPQAREMSYEEVEEFERREDFRIAGATIARLDAIVDDDERAEAIRALMQRSGPSYEPTP